MLPIHAKDKEYRAPPIWHKIAGWIRLLLADKSSRNLFMFLVINLSMAFVELFYGVWTNSLGLISDSFHMFFDCTALLAGLAATLIAKWKANEHFTYGYVRAEIMAGFVNGLFLLFISFFIFSEAVERIFEPPEVKHDRLLFVSILGFLVNLIGIFAFHGEGHGHSHGGGGHGHSHAPKHVEAEAHGGGGHSHGGHGHSHGHGGHGHSHDNHGHSHGIGFGESAPDSEHISTNKIFDGVFLHILADTLGSVGVIISSLLIEWYHWHIADPLCSILIALLISLSVIPLLRDSTGVLMQRQPKELDKQLPGCYHRVSQLEGVYSVQEPHFWTLCSDVYVGALKIEVAPNADAQYITSQTHNIFTAVGVRQLHVQVDFSST